MISPVAAALLTFTAVLLLIVLGVWISRLPDGSVIRAVQTSFTVYHAVMDDGTLTFLTVEDRRDFLLNSDRASVLCESVIGPTEHAMIHRWAKDAMTAAMATSATTRRTE